MDDDEEFLYGEPAPKVEEASEPQSAVEEEDDAPYEPPEDDEVFDTSGVKSVQSHPAAEDAADGDQPYEPEDDLEEEEDSDDDIEIILDSKPSSAPAPGQSYQSMQPPQTQYPTLVQPQAQTKSVIQKVGTTETVKPSPITRTQVIVGQSAPRQDGTVPPPARPPVIQKAVVDVDEVAKFNGMELYTLDLETLEEKPWRRPGADITDFFNYGFNEQTWKMYCAKQTRLREEFPPNAGVKEIAVPGFAADGHPFPMALYAGAPRNPQFDIRAGKRPREDEDEHTAGSEDARERQMRNPRFFPEGFNPEFGGPPPMAMYAPEGPYGHMPPQFDMAPPPGFDPYKHRGAVPPRPMPRGVMPPRGTIRGDRPPFYPMEMDMESPYRPQFGRPGPGFEQRGSAYGRDSRRPSSPRSERDQPN